MGSEGLVMGSGGAPRALVDFFSAAALGALKPRCLDLHTFPFLERRELISFIKGKVVVSTGVEV